MQIYGWLAAYFVLKLFPCIEFHKEGREYHAYALLNSSHLLVELIDSGIHD